MFYIIGLGLGDAKDITIKGLEIVQKCDRVYLESYTSILGCRIDELEEFYGRKLIIADREMVEDGAATILHEANTLKIAFLVVGDPFGATTHTDLILRAKQQGINVKVIHNASIMNAVACCGLQLYSFGETVSIPFWTETWKPDSFFDKIAKNLENNMHTLCLLDIKVKEPTLESLTKKKREYMPPMFMTVSQAARQLLEIVSERKTLFTEESLVIGLARIGCEDQEIVVGTLRQISEHDLGKPLHSLVVPALNLHPLELEYIELFKI